LTLSFEAKTRNVPIKKVNSDEVLAKIDGITPIDEKQESRSVRAGTVILYDSYE
jgi:hypothetical protein